MAKGLPGRLRSGITAGRQASALHPAAFQPVRVRRRQHPGRLFLLQRLRSLVGVVRVGEVGAAYRIPCFTKTLAWHERTHHSPAQRWVRALLTETCDELG